MCHVSVSMYVCVCVPGSRVKAGIGGPGARKAVVIVEAR